LADWYYSSWHEPVTLAIALKELTLSPTVTLNPSFWSLSYEIVISLLFPSFWWLLKRGRGAWSVAALVGCKLLEVWVWRHGFGSTYVGALLYYLGSSCLEWHSHELGICSCGESNICQE
jgi:peptidoglycan/LPS O-acetylase OafA/YrhL